ncbi:MAG TPA: APC family permease [Streptosporangiaceae bacterium]|nr:APC family permease [Streptosporangiaceae bacterium]
MAVESPATFPATGSQLETKLEPNAIGVAQDTVIGMATAAPAASAGLILAGLAAATAYASGPALILMALPMIIIANCYRRLNLWNANCGAAFEWVGRVINPYVGFLVGWLMIMGGIIGTVSTTVVLGPSVLAVFGSNSTAVPPNLGIDTAVILGMLVIAVIGIRITARTQVGMGLIEYVILIGFAIVGLVAVLSHRHGTFPITKGWWSLSGIGGRGSLSAGFLVALFAYTGWDGTVYVNEEVKHRRVNPGRAAMMAVAFMAVIYTVAQVGLQGAVSPAKLQANASDAIVYVAQALGGSGWAKVMALGLALSVIATTGVGIVLGARVIYGMASHRVLPPFLGNVNRRFSTPVAATILVGVVLLGLTWTYLLATSLVNAFNDLIDVTSLLYAAFYILTALAAIIYYWRRVFSNFLDGLILGVLPLAAAGFLGWILVKSLQTAPAAQIWSLVGIVGVGAALMLIARFVLRPQFFHLRPETEGRMR